MKLAEVISPWTGDGSSDNANRPTIGEDYTLVSGPRDVTGQPGQNLHPEPNFMQCRIVAEDAVMAAIEADNAYTVVVGPEDI